VLEAITAAGYKPGEHVSIALDPASSEFYEKSSGKYVFKKSDKSARTSEQMTKILGRMGAAVSHCFDRRRPRRGRLGRMEHLTAELGGKTQLVGDDLFVTNTTRLQRGISEKVGNAILIKLNQIGTVTENHRGHRDGAQGRLRIHRLSPLRRNRRYVHRDLVVAMGTAKSRPARHPAPTASRSTISFYALKRNWEHPPGF